MVKARMTVRKASYLESAWHLDWLTKQKEVDWRTLDYPTAERYAAAVEGEIKPIAYMHHHLGLVLESIAFNPESDAKTRNEAVSELVHNSCSRAELVGAKEIYYISSDERTDESAVKHLGFEKVICYRKRL